MTASGAAARPLVVACDVDGTLTDRDCVVPFLRQVAGTRRLVSALGLRPDRTGAAVLRRDRDRLKEIATHAAFAGRDARTVERSGAAFAERIAERHLRREVVDALRAHRAEGATVILVSASFEVYLRPLADILGVVDDVIGVRLESRDGVLTGSLDGPNTRGQEKVRRLHAWLDQHRGGRRQVRIEAYGDSSGDRQLLADADVAHWMGRYRP